MRCCRPAVLALAALAAALTPAAAQSAPLDRVDSLVAAGEYQAARAGLERWWAEHGSASVPGEARARALMLRAQLAADPAAAEADYLSIVLGYPLSPDAPRALLRLGQGLLAIDEPVRAAGYLQRLVADYPGRPERAAGLLWLARAQRAARQDAAACAVARDGIRDVVGDGDLLAMLRAEESAACGGGRAEADRVPTAEPPPATPPARTPDPPAASTPPRAPPSGPVTGGAAAGTGRFAVQTGAYRQQPSVDAAVARLRRGGYDPRVVVLPGSALIRVRVGRFATSREAGAFMAQLRRDGFDAVVVADAEREQRP